MTTKNKETASVRSLFHQSWHSRFEFTDCVPGQLRTVTQIMCIQNHANIL